jgi:hypothetical protein
MNAGDIIDGRFEVLEEIGKGGMGTVLRVCDQTSGETVALKYCHSNDVILRRRFAREIRVMEMIEHDHVMRVLHSNLGYDPPYFTMPLALRSLRTEITNGMTEDEAPHVIPHKMRWVRKHKAIPLMGGCIFYVKFVVGAKQYRSSARHS